LLVFTYILAKCTVQEAKKKKLLAQWSRVVLEKLTSSQLVKKVPFFY
jgi:hypothetical protein